MLDSDSFVNKYPPKCNISFGALQKLDFFTVFFRQSSDDILHMVARVVGLLPEKYVLNIYEFNPVVLDLKTFIEFRGVVLMRKLKEFQKKTRVR